MSSRDQIHRPSQLVEYTIRREDVACTNRYVCAIYLVTFTIILFFSVAMPIEAQSPIPIITFTPPSYFPTLSLTQTIPATTTPAMAVEVRQPPTSPDNFWEKYGVITAIVSGIVGGILALVFNKLLGPVFEAWGEQLKQKLKRETRRFQECYVPAMADEHRYLKLVGIYGKERVSPPLLKEVFVSLRMGGTDEGLEETKTLSITEAIMRRKRLLILGEPGAGKSTLMDWLTVVFANEISWPALRRQTGDLLPVFLPLRSCVADERPLHALMADPALLPVDAEPPEDFFQTRLDRGRCLVLLDGLDEVIDEHQRTKAAKKINDLVRTYPDNLYIVTCRTAGWKEDLLTSNFARFYIHDFDDTDIARFISSWYRAVRTRAVILRGDLSTDSRERAVKEAEQQAAGESTRLLEALRHNQSLYSLARNPLILSLIALVHYRRTRLPQGRAKLYQECLEILLETWDYEDKELAVIGPTLHAKEAILQEIAYYFHSQGLTEAGRDELETLIAPLLPELNCPAHATETLHQIEERSGILVSRAIGRYTFAHRTLQEYLVARELASNPEKEAVVLLHLRDESWREVILLYSGLIGDKATDLVEAILAQPDDKAHNLLILAGECLTEDVRVAPETRKRVIGNLENAFQSTIDPLTFARLGETLAALGGEDVVAIFGRVLKRGDPPRQLAAIRALGELGTRAGDSTAISIQLCRILSGTALVSGWIESLQVEAALALANLGQTDEKTITTLRNARQDEVYEVRAAALWALLELGKAEEDMVRVPEGKFLMGSPEGEGDSDEHPEHELYLSKYYIARTPVTNAQYARFVADTGHKPPAYWNGNRPPNDLADHPVVYVTWQDCAAYAHWLGGVLPSEAEWEKAASWDPYTGRKRRYPWNDQWNPEWCNTEEKGLNQTTPVGKYSPDSDSVYGCADMAGNVWEWTRSSNKEYPYDPEDGREEIKKSSNRVLRGGSFDFSSFGARSAFRLSLQDHPDDHMKTVGFRVGVVADPSSPKLGS